MSFQRRFRREDVRILSRERVFEGHFAVDRLLFQHRTFAGGWCEPVTREVFERGNAVAVLPYEPESDSLILIEQFRAGVYADLESPWMLELIAGVLEDGESDEELAHREADEEAGCELGELVPAATYYPSAGACSEHVRLYCGQVLSAAVGEVRGLEDEGEDILVHCLQWSEVEQLLDADQINNGHTLLALQWFARHRARLRERWAGQSTE